MKVIGGRTVTFEFHPWDGVGRCGGPLGSGLTIGWMTVRYMPFLLSQWLKARVGAMKNALNASQVPPRDSMACWGEDKPLHRAVPRGRT